MHDHASQEVSWGWEDVAGKIKIGSRGGNIYILLVTLVFLFEVPSLDLRPPPGMLPLILLILADTAAAFSSPHAALHSPLQGASKFFALHPLTMLPLCLHMRRAERCLHCCR